MDAPVSAPNATPLSDRERIEAILAATPKKEPLDAIAIAEKIGKTAAAVSGVLGQLYYAGKVDRTNLNSNPKLPRYAYSWNKLPRPPRAKPITHRTSAKQKALAAAAEAQAQADAEKLAAQEAQTRAKAEARAAKEAPAAQEHPAPSEAAPPVAAQNPAPVLPPQPAPAAPTATPLAQVDRLLDSLGQQLAEQLLVRIVANLTTSLPAFFPAVAGPVAPTEAPAYPAAPSAAHAKLPKVAVVGLLPDQEALIRAEFSDHFVLSFPQKNNAGKLRAAAAFSDHVLTMTSFIGHHVENTLKSAGAHLVRVAGGMTDLRHQLQVLHVMDQAHAPAH